MRYRRLVRMLRFRISILDSISVAHFDSELHGVASPQRITLDAETVTISRTIRSFTAYKWTFKFLKRTHSRDDCLASV